MNPKEQPTIYNSETLHKKEKSHLSLSDEQKKAVRRITLGIEEVDKTARQMAQEDVIKTLENGHPLNRLITNEAGDTVGYIACEDFVPQEAYIKYFATAGATGRNMLKEIPAFLEYSKGEGYLKLNFHGWNERLNHIMERYGFKRLKTDSWADLKADFYEKTLAEPKTPEQISEQRRRAFEEKYIQKLEAQYTQIITSFSKEKRSEKEQGITGSLQTLSNRLRRAEDFAFGNLQKAVLKIKLARHFQGNQTIDTNTLFDAVIESPKFLNTDKGSLHRLLEVHEQKTLEKIAEMRKKRAEMIGQEELNPYEALLGSKSGNYYLARLLNMLHLEQESEYMAHCVGTSDSYLNQIKKGEIEILSFRNIPRVNPKTQKLEGDTPILTIEYNLKTRIIEQIKKKDDEYLKPDNPFFDDLLDILRRFQDTPDDTGKKRTIKKINPNELQNFEVKPYHLLTDKGEIHFRNINLKDKPLIIKTGEIDLDNSITSEDVAKLLGIFENIEFNANQIARKPDQINKTTKAYVGKLEAGVFDKIQEYHLERIYTSFPEGKIELVEMEIGGLTAEQLKQAIKNKKDEQSRDYQITSYAQDMMNHSDFIASVKERLKIPETVQLIRLKVCDLFPDNQNHTTEELWGGSEKGASGRIQELGLELCPPETGPHLSIKYEEVFKRPQALYEYLRVGMKPIAVRDGRSVRV